MLYRNGRIDSLKVGDKITVDGWVAKDGSNLANMRTAILPTAKPYLARHQGVTPSEGAGPGSENDLCFVRVNSCSARISANTHTKAPELFGFLAHPVHTESCLKLSAMSLPTPLWERNAGEPSIPPGIQQVSVFLPVRRVF